MKSKKYLFDDSLQIGDIVVDHYSGCIGELVSITKRYVNTPLEARIYEAAIGDEYNPLVEIKLLSRANGALIKKPKTIISRDGGYAIRLSRAFFIARYEELQNQVKVWKTAQNRFGV